MVVKPVKKHWYLLSFNIQHPGAWVPLSFVHGFDEMRITIPELLAAKQINQVGNNSVMLAVSYMGFGSEREINGMPEVDPPSHTSDSFREGMTAAMANPITNTLQPVNPYTQNVDNNDPHVMHAASEWQAGYNLYRETEKAVPVKVVSPPIGDQPTVLGPPIKDGKPQK